MVKNGIHRLLRRAPTSFTTCDACRYFADQALLRRHNIGQAQNIYYQRKI